MKENVKKYVLAVAASFHLHINTEPSSISPLLQKSASGAYLFTQIHSPLLKFSDGKLTANLAKCQQLSPTKISCDIDPLAKFNDGSDITAVHFKNTFLAFLNSKKPGLRADLLFAIKNAKKYLQGDSSAEAVGISGNKKKLLFELENPYSEFIYNLANPILSPLSDINNPESKVTSGPYKIKNWQPRNKIELIKNEFAINAHPERPDLVFSFIKDDTTALNLYETNQLDFLRRLPTLLIPKYKSRKDFHATSQFRFDYFGISAKLTDLSLRKTLVEALNYDDLQTLYSAEPRPGCIVLPAAILSEKICYNLQKNTQKKDFRKLTLAYSKQGSSDVHMAAQWLQSEWKKNAQLDVQLMPMESKIFNQQLQNNSFDLFHRGLNPDRVSCLAILESFSSAGSENFLQITESKFINTVNKLRLATTTAEKSKLCAQGLHYLIDNYILIPTGPVYFSALLKETWQGLNLNELNILDLSQLHFAGAVSKSE